MRTVKNWHVVEHDGFISVRGELWDNVSMLFSQFDTHNPTIINEAETECESSTGVRLRLENKRAFA
jgi:hypothetical protein